MNCMMDQCESRFYHARTNVNTLSGLTGDKDRVHRSTYMMQVVIYLPKQHVMKIIKTAWKTVIMLKRVVITLFF